MPNRRRTPAPLTKAGLDLDPDRLATTIGTLERRIEERFPGSGLARVCASLRETAELTKERLDYVEQPILWLRAATWLLGGLMAVAGIGVIVAVVRAFGGVSGAFGVLTTMESGIQDLVFIGIGLAFLVTGENRVKRTRALEFLRELRAIAHVVDIHQLTKDPARVMHPGANTKSSPTRTFDGNQLGRYLDYCSEMLSLTSKIAALYGQRFSDGIVLQAIDEVENLTTGLSRKIWQKIMILDTHAPRALRADDLGGPPQDQLTS